jgi:hypothetical protein
VKSAPTFFRLFAEKPAPSLEKSDYGPFLSKAPAAIAVRSYEFGAMVPYGGVFWEVYVFIQEVTFSTSNVD